MNQDLGSNPEYALDCHVQRPYYYLAKQVLHAFIGWLPTLNATPEGELVILREGLNYGNYPFNSRIFQSVNKTEEISRWALDSRPE